MFILSIEEFEEFSLEKAKQFVDYWSNRYYYTIKTFDGNEVIHYINELNIGNNLTEQNIKRLLRWKDPMRLTESNLSGENKKVSSVILKTSCINKFRQGEINETEFKNETKNIFPTGLVWPIFLFHIARPFEYPIADRNTFRAFSTQKKTTIPKDWNGYTQYGEYFFQIAISSGIIAEKPKGNENDIKDTVKKLKKVDDALFIFGQFLRRYDDERKKTDA